MKAYSILDKLIRMVKIMYDYFECSVLEEVKFKITTDVKQGCIMSGFLILLTGDWIMRRTTEGIEMASDGTSQVCLKTSTLQLT